MHTTQRRSAERIMFDETNDTDEQEQAQAFADLCDDAVAGWDTDIAGEED